ncbi:hypothetical protein P3T76_003649 [Phytophthora citrophthora]|uniref:Uncharacterized protein n=1 Tax=Phytophthora citrophthora TaxID=4793 RepID=A0AAD9GV30_9STRA|nr:hypothetical protein P3T76_003649 [Phytophthora citrophthora]
MVRYIHNSSDESWHEMGQASRVGGEDEIEYMYATECLHFVAHLCRFLATIIAGLPSLDLPLNQ